MADLKLVINIDGACLGNPGPGGIGVVIYGEDGKIIEEYSEPIGMCTCNVAEYKALILALSGAASLGDSGQMSLLIRTDSELLQQQVTGRWKVKASGLKDLWWCAALAMRPFAKVEIVQIPREENEEADRLAGVGASR